MPNPLKKFISDFKTKYQFKETKSQKASFGSLITKINLSPIAVFELLEILFGNYEDIHDDILYIDNKTSWERYIDGKSGTFRVYEYRGSTSIGTWGIDFLTNLPNSYKEEAEDLKKALEGAWPIYQIAKAKQIKEELAEQPMINFTRAFLSTKILLERAVKAGSLLEILVLRATLLDGMLRFGAILTIQLKERSDHIRKELILQEGKKYIAEREIYKIAKNEGVIDEDSFNEINSLYDFRNVAIHRFFISDFEYNEIKSVINRYAAVLEKVNQRLVALQEQQIKEGVGMTKQEDLELNDELVKQIRREEYLKINSETPIAVVPKRNFLFDKDD